MLFTKVRAALIAAGIVILGAVVAWAAEFDWDTLGPLGPIVATVVPVVVAYVVRELRGYGSGVPRPEDELPGGEPLPTGAAGEEAFLTGASISDPIEPESRGT